MDDARKHFDYRLTHSHLKAECTFPFVVTSATARNPQYETENRNSQDAAGVYISDTFITGVVCDGCTSTHPTFAGHAGSSNEIGAKLATHLLLTETALALNEKPAFDLAVLTKRLARRLVGGFRSVIKAHCGKDPAAAEQFIYDYMMTTAIGFVVTKEQFVVYYSGDGVIGIDGKPEIIKTQSDEGVHYFSNTLLPVFCPNHYPRTEVEPLHLHVAGPSKALQSIFIASDGFGPVVTQHADELARFINQQPHPNQCSDGFDFSLEEFRRDIAWNPKIRCRLNDDATFVLVRRPAS